MKLSLKFGIGIIAFTALVWGGVNYFTQNAKAQNTQIINHFNYKPQPNGVSYPTKEWQYQKLNPQLEQKLSQITAPAFADKNGDLGETRTILIIKDGKIIFEKYGKGFDKDTRQISWSMAKSITSALFGIMEKDGKLNRNNPIADPHWKSDDARAKITYLQALQMKDGINWREENYNDPIRNDAAIMLFGAGREDIVKYATSRSLKNTPGETWNYSSGTTNIIAAGISRAAGQRSLSDPTGKGLMRTFMFDRLFKPIGMTNTSPEFDASGNFYASSLVYSTAQDFARFGYLFLRGGKWENQQIINQDFVDFVRTPANSQKSYGAHWWLASKDSDSLLKNGPYDAFYAQGHEGQVILIVPSKDLVIVRLGQSTAPKHWEAIGKQLQQLVDAL